MRRSVPYPRSYTYATAGRVFNETKPIRGTDYRPLGRRSSNNSAQIMKDGENYVIRLYRTDVVTYRPDGSVVLNTGGYATQSTAQAMDSVSPFNCRLVRGTLVASCKDGSFQVSNKLEFDPDGKPVNPVPWVVHKRLVNKEKAKRVREYFKLVPQYIRTYPTAFAGGIRPEVQPVYPDLEAGGALPDEDASRFAWGHIGGRAVFTTSGIRTHILDLGGTAVTNFWKRMYNDFDVIETHEVTLPYGQVK